MKAVYIDNRGRKTFIGKHIKDVIYREFAFTRAVLWQNKSLSFDSRMLAYAQSQSVKKFVFTDTVKRKSYEIGIRALTNNSHTEDHGQGEQLYFPLDLAKKIKYKKTPFVKKEVVLEDPINRFLDDGDDFTFEEQFENTSIEDLE